MSRKMHLVGNEMELCGYETSDGFCVICSEEREIHDDKIRAETKAKVLKMLNEEIKSLERFVSADRDIRVWSKYFKERCEKEL